jgi:hypothetical protein
MLASGIVPLTHSIIFNVPSLASAYLVCTRTIAITPSQYRSFPWEQVVKVCRDYALRGVETISQLPRDGQGKPFRFVYVSGNNAERDPNKKPMILGDYCLMRVGGGFRFSFQHEPLFASRLGPDVRY